MKDEELIWEEISTEHIVQDEWIDFRRSAYRFPDGKIWQPYYSFTRRDYAVVVATDEQGCVICVRQFRQGIRQVTTEFPAGAIEQKDGEDPQTAALRGAQRELRRTTTRISSPPKTAARSPDRNWTQWNSSAWKPIPPKKSTRCWRKGTSSSPFMRWPGCWPKKRTGKNSSRLQEYLFFFFGGIARLIPRFSSFFSAAKPVE